MWRTNSWLVAKNAACGPPNPSGTPKRCELPNTTSAPASPGDVASASASRSVATATFTFAACALSMNGFRSYKLPASQGYCTSAPNTSGASKFILSLRTISSLMPSGSARLRSTSIVCGKQRSETRNVPCASPSFLPCTRCSSVIASPAAVPSSSSDALATAIPVRSETIVWKLRSDSRRPCAISA